MITARSFTDVVSGLGGSTRIAEICLVSKNTAASWVRRRTIPVRVWPRLLASPDGRSLGLTSDELVSLHSGDFISPAEIDRPVVIEEAA